MKGVFTMSEDYKKLIIELLKDATNEKKLKQVYTLLYLAKEKGNL